MNAKQLGLLGLDAFMDLSEKRVFIGLSGGINSAAVLCYLSTIHPVELRPKKVFAFYAHLKEHSPDTLAFVRHLVMYGKRNYPEFHFKFSVASVNEFFKKEKFIPHPKLSPCTEHLKMIPMIRYQAEMETDINLVGYVHHEKRRIERMERKAKEGENFIYPLAEYSDNDCLALVKREIGWYPAIYDIRDEKGKIVFRHNNCLPCKNMQGNLLSDGTTTKNYEAVQKHFPQYYANALKTLKHIEAATGQPNYWGRKPSDESTDTGCTDYVCEA